MIRNFSQRFIYAIFLIICLNSTAQAGSGTENLASGMTITRFGSAVGSGAFFDTAEVPGSASPHFCLYGLYNLDLSSPGGKALLAMLLSAQQTGRKIVRLDWNGGGTAAEPALCYVVTIILKD